MLNITIIPYKGIEINKSFQIEFGLNRKKLRTFFEDKDRKTYLKSQYAKLSTDAYYQSGLQFSFKQPGLLQAILLTPSLGPIVLEGKDILYNTSYQEAFDFIKNIDSEIEFETDDSIISHKLGLILGQPVEDPVIHSKYYPEYLVVFERNYLLS